jgi:hypothetical protein
MKFFDSQWERVSTIITPAYFKIGLAILSLVALALGGAADDSWG